MWHSIQFSSVAQSCLTLCNPMNRSTPGLPIHHQLPEFTQTHIHRVSDAIHARDGVSREVPCSALKGETVPDSLPAPHLLSPRSRTLALQQEKPLQ